MKFKIIKLCICLVFSKITFAQNDKKLSLSIEYGPQANFFVKSYNENDGVFSTNTFYNKRLIGRIGSLELNYKIAKNGTLKLGFSNAVNKREVDFTSNNIGLSIKDFEISHMSNFYQLILEKSFNKNKPSLKYEIGIVYARTNQQEISILDIPGGSAEFEERSFKHYRLEEGGVVLGLIYSKKIDTKFTLGVRTKVYYLISTNKLEAISLTPCLSYNF